MKEHSEIQRSPFSHLTAANQAVVTGTSKLLNNSVYILNVCEGGLNARLGTTQINYPTVYKIVKTSATSA